MSGLRNVARRFQDRRRSPGFDPAAVCRSFGSAKHPWGYKEPRDITYPDFTPAELANRVTNASLLRLVESYRKHGHRAAKLDPLSLAARPKVPALDPRRYGLNLPSDVVREEFVSDVRPPAIPETRFDVQGILDFPLDEQVRQDGKKTSREIYARLEQVYTAGVGYEFYHLPSKHERRFLEKLLEQSHASAHTLSEQRSFWSLLARSEGFDRWAAAKFPNVKRYGLEGGESMMVCLAVAFEKARQDGVEEIVMAMPHRGRLNVLIELLGLDPRLLVRKMRGLPTLPPSFPSAFFTDDVLSHLFISSEIRSPLSRNPLTVHLLPNPSHLEAVNPVALGFARGLQIPYRALAEGPSMELGDKVISLQIHGDAAWAGQGVVAESLNLAGLPHFNVGGTLRIVVNNQLGYTTPASSGRTSFYATDLAKGIGAPIVHVNGDRPEDVSRAVSLAVAYQRKFRTDIVIDLVVYRRRGHNELDEPGFTSPLMYNAIASLPSIPQTYEKSLLQSGAISHEDVDEVRVEQSTRLDLALTAADPSTFTVPELEMARDWATLRWPCAGEWEAKVDTGADAQVMKMVGRQSVEVPDNITVHPRLSRMHIAKRLQSIEKGSGIDFATAEAMAFGSLMLDGYHIRLSGQDSGRGTFSQRHAILADQQSSKTVVPLESLTHMSSATTSKRAGTIEIVNSPLSEYVIGFEQGLSWVKPDMLPIWEAQFGDFANTAAVAIDTFLVSGESKWGMQTGLTLLLPHGYDSGGPEHSSARIERFLQLSNEPIARQPFIPNLHCVNVTTAAQYFHVLRRQMCRNYRKPLIVFSPKKILRLAAAASELGEMTSGTAFDSVVDDPSVRDKGAVQRVVMLSGQLYYDLVKARKERGLDGQVALVRVEELTPFPYPRLASVLSSYASASSFVWAQEEPENAGAYTFVAPRLGQLLPPNAPGLRYAGRPAMATPAPGVKAYFDPQTVRLLDDVFAEV